MKQPKQIVRTDMFSMLLVLLIIISCSSKTENNLLISLSNPIDKNISLSSIVKDIRYVKISPDISIRLIRDIKCTKDYYFVLCLPELILMYDKKGDFIRKIGSQGRGPNQYERLSSFDIDDQNKEVLVLSNSRIVKIYDFNGNFLRSLNIGKLSDFNRIYLFDQNKLLLASGNPYGQAKYNWIITDMRGNILSSKINYIKFDLPQKIGLSPSLIVFLHNNYFYYYESFNDTIFNVQVKSHDASYIFRNDKYRLTSNRFVKEAPGWVINGTSKRLQKREKYYYLREIFMTSKYVWLGYSLDYFSQVALIDRKSNILFAVSNSGALSGIQNDIDSGIPFFPNSYFQEDNTEYLICWIDAFKLKAHVASDTFKNSIPKYPEKKKELEKLANSLSENDNPVLMLVKLKE